MDKESSQRVGPGEEHSPAATARISTRFNCEEQSHKAVSTNHNLFEEKGEPKRYRTEVLPLTNLTPYR